MLPFPHKFLHGNDTEEKVLAVNVHAQLHNSKRIPLPQESNESWTVQRQANLEVCCSSQEWWKVSWVSRNPVTHAVTHTVSHTCRHTHLCLWRRGLPSNILDTTTTLKLSPHPLDTSSTSLKKQVDRAREERKNNKSLSHCSHTEWHYSLHRTQIQTQHDTRHMHMIMERKELETCAAHVIYLNGAA